MIDGNERAKSARQGKNFDGVRDPGVFHGPYSVYSREGRDANHMIQASL